VHGRELWVSDGTQAGTRLVIDLDQGPGDGVLAGTLASLGATGLVGFAGHDGGDGLQLWASDGSAPGTLQLGRLGAVAGAGAATLHSLRLVGTKLFFVADDGVLGEELWVFELGAPNLALAQNYGSSSCPGTGNRTPRIAPFGLPAIGNNAFAVDVDNAMPNSLAVLFLSFAPSAIVLDGCRVLLGLPATSLSAVFTDTAGAARTPFPIPANPALQGVQVFGQYLVLDPNGPLFGDFSLSDGLRMRVGT
jgi:ELWxxDGT repeat protein